MDSLVTERLVLLPLSAAVMAKRVETDDFEMVCVLPDGPRAVHFGPQWPGAMLGLYPGLVEAVGAEGVVDLGYTVVEVASAEAVGQLGTKGPIGVDGTVEIGYGLNRDVRGRGLATEAVGALVAQLRRRGVTTVTAQTAVTNVASQKVLQHNGFERTGTGWDREDGDLLSWARTP